jgi:hypothetical protein
MRKSTTSVYVIVGALLSFVAIYSIPIAHAAPLTTGDNSYNDIYVKPQVDFQKVSQDANKKYSNAMIEIQSTYNLAKLDAKLAYVKMIKENPSKTSQAKLVYQQMMSDAKSSYLADIKNVKNSYYQELQQIQTTYSKPPAVWYTA